MFVNSLMEAEWITRVKNSASPTISSFVIKQIPPWGAILQFDDDPSLKCSEPDLFCIIQILLDLLEVDSGSGANLLV